jgi:hypothetical protein
MEQEEEPRDSGHFGEIVALIFLVNRTLKASSLLARR